MMRTTGIICDSHTCQRPGCSPSTGCQGHVAREQAPHYFRLKFEQMVAKAAEQGLVVTIELQPLAMGHYRPVIDIRPATRSKT